MSGAPFAPRLGSIANWPRGVRGKAQAFLPVVALLLLLAIPILILILILIVISIFPSPVLQTPSPHAA
jgi:hypothetical protein